MTNPHTETKPVQHPPERERARKDAEEILRWPGRNDALFPLAHAYLALLAAYEDRSKAFERAAADCVLLAEAIVNGEWEAAREIAEAALAEVEQHQEEKHGD